MNYEAMPPSSSLVAQLVKNRLQCGRPGFDPWVENIPWRRKQLPTPVFWPRESHGQRSLVGCSPRGRRESDVTERLSHTLVPGSAPLSLHKILTPHWPHECPPGEQTQVEDLLVTSRENRAVLLP